MHPSKHFFSNTLLRGVYRTNFPLAYTDSEISPGIKREPVFIDLNDIPDVEIKEEAEIASLKRQRQELDEKIEAAQKKKRG